MRRRYDPPRCYGSPSTIGGPAIKGQRKCHPSTGIVFLTGAAGLVGKALLGSANGHHVHALYHQTPVVNAGINLIKGDLRLPRFGLSKAEYGALAGKLDTIVHSAAITTFGVSDEQIRAINTEGTRRVVELAACAKARLIYVSTAYVHPDASIVAPASAYEDSKRDAEKLVRSLVGQHVIVRPSIILGDSQTGESAAYQGMHHVLGAIINRAMPVLPTDPSYLCDFVAQDWVADAIWGAVEHPSPHPELWVTAGEDALTIGSILQIVLDIGDRHGFEGAPPRIVSHDTVQRLFVPVFLASLPHRARLRFEANLKLTRYMNQVQALPSSKAYLQDEFGLPPRAAHTDVLIRSMEQWIRDQPANRREAREERSREPPTFRNRQASESRHERRGDGGSF